MNNQFVPTTILFCILAFSNFAFAVGVYWDDGTTHQVNTPIHQNDIIWLDKNVQNSPGTHLLLTDGGKIDIILPFGISSITMTGGQLGGSNVAIDTHGDNQVLITGGTIIGDIASNNNSQITVEGGAFHDDLYAYDNGIVEVKGGQIDGVFGVFESGIIYLYGSDFQLDGIDLNAGDRLRDFAQLSTNSPEYYHGLISGILSDGTVLNNDFWIWQYTDADIIIVPEPATLILLGLGGLLIRKKK